jgi:hypothetical protein
MWFRADELENVKARPQDRENSRREKEHGVHSFYRGRVRHHSCDVKKYKFPGIVNKNTTRTEQMGLARPSSPKNLLVCYFC